MGDLFDPPILLGLLAFSCGACAPSGGGATNGTADGGIDANSGSGEAGHGAVSSSSGAASSSGSSGTSGSSSGSGSSGGSSSSSGSGSSVDSGLGGGSGLSGDAGAACALPTSFDWTSTGPLAQPKSGWASLKNFSDVIYDNQHIVYFSSGTTSETWAGGMMTFTDWPQMATATQYTMPEVSAAPTLIYFAPKNVWVLVYQYGQWTFSYMTSRDPTNPNGWSSPHELYQGNGIDNTVICNGTTCYLFFTDDNGNVYRASMPIGDFPGVFTDATTVLSDSNKDNLFEAEQVYTVKGANQYLMIVEAIGSTGHRYFRSFTASDLGGSWAPLAATEGNPFAGEANVTFSDGNAWTPDFSHGDMVRDNDDETQTIDPCNLQFLYQGDAPSSGLSYIELPYRPGLLTLVP